MMINPNILTMSCFITCAILSFQEYERSFVLLLFGIGDWIVPLIWYILSIAFSLAAFICLLCTVADFL